MKRPHRHSVLFVDDEQQILDGLKRSPAPRDKWSTRFALSGEDALCLIEADPPDAIVSDMRMPGMTGVALLHEVRERWPGIVRIMLSGQTDQSELIEDIGAVHQFLHKPCPADVIVQAITRAMQMASAITTKPLRDLATGLESLPVVSNTYRELLDVLEKPDSDLEAVSAVVERDIGLSTKLLQMVNSAFFAMPRPVTTVHDAVLLLGLSNLRALVITAQIFKAMASLDERDAVLARLWNTSIDIGAAAHMLAREHGQPTAVCENARLAGLLSLVGRSVFVYGAPERFKRAQARSRDEDLPLYQCEHDELGAAQHSLGAYALGLWAFSREILEAVSMQATPGVSDITTLAHPLPYVHAARSCFGHGDLVERVDLDEHWLSELGFETWKIPINGQGGWEHNLAS